MHTAAPTSFRPFTALRTLLATTALCGTLSGALPAAAQTLPAGGRMVEGQATIGTPTGGRLDVTQTSPEAVVDWQSFSVGASGPVDFAQPGRDAVIPNRVTTPNLPSDIQGCISANGQVWLVNPSGIFIGAGAKIDVAGFLATTHDIVSAAGTLSVTASAGAIALNADGVLTRR
jgi:filamentous hemagglutinin family protein